MTGQPVPRLSVIIVTMNSESFIDACLRSIEEQDRPFPVDIVVVDNNSSDRTAEIASRHPGVRLFRNQTNAGFNPANNQGIRATAGEYVLLLNPDTRLEPGALNALVRCMEDDPGVAVGGPRILNGDGTLQRTGVTFPKLWNVFVETWFLDRLFPGTKLFGDQKKLYLDPGRRWDADYLQGSCIIIRRSYLDRAGLMDEQFFMYFDESDFCRRCKEAGGVVRYFPEAAVTHFGGGDTGYYDTFRLVQYHRSMLLFVRKHEPDRLAAFRILLFARGLLREAILLACSIVPGRRRAEFSDRAAGYREVLRLLLGGRLT